MWLVRTKRGAIIFKNLNPEGRKKLRQTEQKTDVTIRKQMVRWQT